MLLDAGILLAYFVTILVIGIMSRSKQDASAAEYFLSSRSLRWPAIAMSTIATNISASHFLGMAGSSYKYGLAQGNFELNAILGIVISAFIFVPMFLKAQVTTITEFFEMKFGARVSFTYSFFMLLLYGFLYLGGALFWAAYALDQLFPELTGVFGSDTNVRLIVLIVGLGVFSAFYTYLGGLTAVVRTDKVQFVLLLVGGLTTLYFAISAIGGFGALWELRAVDYPTDHPMHLHLPASDSKLPWFALLGMNLLNLQYWGANQVILQRALAAKDLKHAQLGLLVGGVIKYAMVLIIIIPALTLLDSQYPRLDDPDQAYVTLIRTVVKPGVRGLILLGLFASMMSTVDSIFNSLSTLFSIDIYKRHLRPHASDKDLVAIGKMAIGGALITGLSFAFLVVYLKSGPQQKDALSHFFKEMGYYIKNGFVVLIVAATFLKNPPRHFVFAGLLASIPIYFIFDRYLPRAAIFPGVSYLERAGWTIVIATAVVAVPSWWQGRKNHGWLTGAGELLAISTPRVGWLGAGLLATLVAIHIVFH